MIKNESNNSFPTQRIKLLLVIIPYTIYRIPNNSKHIAIDVKNVASNLFLEIEYKIVIDIDFCVLEKLVIF